MAHSSRKVHINTLMVHCPWTVHRKCTWWTTVHEASHDRYKEEEPQPFSTQATLQPPATLPSPLSTSSLIECASTSWRFWPGGRKGNQGFVRSFEESDRWQTPTGTRRQEEEVKKKDGGDLIRRRLLFRSASRDEETAPTITSTRIGELLFAAADHFRCPFEVPWRHAARLAPKQRSSISVACHGGGCDVTRYQCVRKHRRLRNNSRCGCCWWGWLEGVAMLHHQRCCRW